MKFYTNVHTYGNSILYRGYENGNPIKEKVENFYPTLYAESPKPTNFTTIQGTYVEPINPGTIKDCREFMEQYKDVSNFNIYGNTGWIYQYIASLYPNHEDAEYDMNSIRVAVIDIETESENGFSSVEEVSERINVITIRINDKRWVFALGKYTLNLPNTECREYTDEKEMLEDFLIIWNQLAPDAITGWNIRSYDLPYLINRITKLIDLKTAKKISPWGLITEEKLDIRGKEVTTYKITGISILDYYELYRKYTYVTQESYTLDNIASVELGKRKLDYSQYESLKDFYTQDFQKFVEYNVVDVDIVKELDEKLNLLELHISLAYLAKCNYDDVMSQVRTWDCIIYNHLLKKNVVVHQRKHQEKSEQFSGAYVKDPQVGFHNWVVSFDLTSLYPSLMIGTNISADTISDESIDVTIEDLLNKKIDTSFLKEKNLCLAANGKLFHRDKQGFLGELMDMMFKKRAEAKKKAQEYESQIEKTEDPKEKEKLKKLFAKYDTLQKGYKISANSCYGGIGNEYSRFYDTRQAEAITLTGQLSIRWIQIKLNEYLNKLFKTQNEDYVIASDTDSCMLNLEKAVLLAIPNETNKTKIIDFLNKFCKEILTPFINKKYVELGDYLNSYSQRMEMKREVIADRGVWTAKKRYMMNVYDSEGVRYHEPKLKIMGIEVQRSSTPKICRDRLKECIKIILTKDEETLIQYIEDFKEQFKKLTPEEIAFPRGVNGMKEYADEENVFSKGTPIAVKGALIYNDLLKKHKLTKKYSSITSGDKIKFVYLKEPNPTKEKIISFSKKLPTELDLHKYVDYNTQFEKAFIDPLKNIVNSIGWSFERKNSLSGMFEV